MWTFRGRPPRGLRLAGGSSGATIAHCSSVRSDGYCFRLWPVCTIGAHSSAARICANYLLNLLFCQAMFPDSLLVEDEMPRHRVYLDTFYIDKYEVTNAHFQQFVHATSYRTQAEREGWGWADTEDA